MWRNDAGRQRGGWSREEVWEEKCRLLGAQKWKDWETCSEVRVRGRERVGLGLECVYGTEVTVCACRVNFCLCAWSGVWLSHPHTWIWILWSRLDCVWVYECLHVLVSMCAVTGSLNSSVQAEPDRQVTRPACKGLDNSIQRSCIVPVLQFCFLLHPRSLLCKLYTPIYQVFQITPKRGSTPQYNCCGSVGFFLLPISSFGHNKSMAAEFCND